MAKKAKTSARHDLMTEIESLYRKKRDDDPEAAIYPSWLTHEIVENHPLPKCAEREWYLVHAHDNVRSHVNTFIRALDDGKADDRQRILPGYSYLQQEYSIKRDGEVVIVPLQSMTAAEGYAKCDELDKTGRAYQKHAREKRKYWDERVAREEREALFKPQLRKRSEAKKRRA